MDDEMETARKFQITEVIIWDILGHDGKNPAFRAGILPNIIDMLNSLGPGTLSLCK